MKGWGWGVDVANSVQLDGGFLLLMGRMDGGIGLVSEDPTDRGIVSCCGKNL